jgi:predicted alpha/beta-hydrolase family hydrolase
MTGGQLGACLDSTMADQVSRETGAKVIGVRRHNREYRSRHGDGRASGPCHRS